MYRSGLYQNNSFGKSDKAEFDNFGFKGGITYKITGRNYFTANAAYMTKAPSMRNTFINSRSNNEIVANLEGETVSSLDASYIIRTPKLKARITGFYSLIKNSTKIGFFYAEGLAALDEGDGGEDEFVAELTKGIDKKNIGAELGVEYQLTSTLKFTGAASYGKYIYDNNPNVSLSVDGRQAAGLNPIVDFGKSYLKTINKEECHNKHILLVLNIGIQNFGGLCKRKLFSR